MWSPYSVVLLCLLPYVFNFSRQEARAAASAELPGDGEDGDNHAHLMDVHPKVSTAYFRTVLGV